MNLGDYVIDKPPAVCYNQNRNIYRSYIFQGGNHMKINRTFSALTAACMLLCSIPALHASAGNFSRVSVHDPSVVKLEEGGYYIIGSHLGEQRVPMI